MAEHLFVYLDPEELHSVRQRLEAGDKNIVEEVERLAKEADLLLELPPTSVMDKTAVAASGDPHDFFAIGGYSWPNPSTQDGLPYQYRDSETNPEALTSEAYDKGRYEQMTDRVATLALAYFFTADERYAAHAAKLLRTWFTDAETGMNPNFRFAAARPGVWDGHFSGTIEGVYLIEMLDYVALIDGSLEWRPSDQEALRTWFRELSEWLSHSSFGRREIYSTNNHSSYLLAQIIVFATYGRVEERAQRGVHLSRRNLVRQIAADGSLPREIYRADGWFYSIYALRAFTVIARAAERYGTDLWRDRGGLLPQACASLAPYLTGDAVWPFTRGQKPWRRDAVQLFHLAGRAYGSEDLLQTAKVIALHTDEPIAHLGLLWLEHTKISPKGAELPRPRPWQTSLVPRHSLRLTLEASTSRVFGLLAARGIWCARFLP